MLGSITRNFGASARLKEVLTKYVVLLRLRRGATPPEPVGSVVKSFPESAVGL